MMTVPQPLWFFVPMLILMVEQPLMPRAVLPTLGAVLVAAGGQHRLARSRRPAVARFFRRMSPVDRRWGTLVRLVDDGGRRWESRFLPVRAMELGNRDPVFVSGWTTRRGDLTIWKLANIRTGSHRMNRRLAVWPVVAATSAVAMFVVLGALPL